MSIGQDSSLLKVGFKHDSIGAMTTCSLDQLKCLNIREDDCLEMLELEVDEARSLFLNQVRDPSYSIQANDEKYVILCIKHCYFRKGNRRSIH